MANNKGISSPADDLAFGVKTPGDGGRPGFPTQTPGPGPRIVEQHLSQGDAPSNPRSGSRGSVDRSVTSDAVIKTQ